MFCVLNNEELKIVDVLVFYCSDIVVEVFFLFSIEIRYSLNDVEEVIKDEICFLVILLLRCRKKLVIMYGLFLNILVLF